MKSSSAVRAFGNSTVAPFDDSATVVPFGTILMGQGFSVSCL